MNRDDITRMARAAGFVGFDGENKCLRQFADLIAAAERNILAAWMMQRSYATGHGDTIEDLLKELEWQVIEREREACAKLCEEEGLLWGQRYAAAIRARGQS